MKGTSSHIVNPWSILFNGSSNLCIIQIQSGKRGKCTVLIHPNQFCLVGFDAGKLIFVVSPSTFARTSKQLTVGFCGLKTLAAQYGMGTTMTVSCLDTKNGGFLKYEHLWAPQTMSFPLTIDNFKDDSGVPPQETSISLQPRLFPNKTQLVAERRRPLWWSTKFGSHILRISQLCSASER